MIYMQWEYLRESDDMDRNSTYKIDLPENGYLSAIQIRIGGAGQSGVFAETEKWRICDYIDKIEIIGNGSTVIKSITGNVLQALQAFDTGITSLDYWHSFAESTKRFNVMLLFGRHMFDMEYGLDLARWDSVELRVTNSGTSTYFKQDFSIGTLCYYWRGDFAGFTNYIRTEEWRKWTTVQNETKYLELPTENKIRRVVIQAVPGVDANNVEKTNIWSLAYDVELSLKTGVLRIYKGSSEDIVRMNTLFLKKLQLTYPQYYMTADYGRNVGIGYVLGGAWGSGSQDGAGSDDIPTLEGMRTSYTQKPETYEGQSPIHALHVGHAPENCFFFPFHWIDEPVYYLDPAAEKTVKLNIKTRDHIDAVGGTIRIILDSLG